MDSFYQKRLATKEARIQEMRKAHALLERQVRLPRKPLLHSIFASMS